MTYRLINLLSWLPGHSGFGSYVQRVVPDIIGLRLQLAQNGQPELIYPQVWLPDSPSWAPTKWMRFLQRYSLVQHGVDLAYILKQNELKVCQIEGIYSPFFDAFLGYPTVPQLITCHDLTPLVASNSRKAWLRYRFWQPRHCRSATRIIAISRYVADQLIDFGVESDRIEVIPNGVSASTHPITEPLTDDLLVLSRHDINKNLPAIFRGISKFQSRLPAWRGVLRIVGRSGRQTSLIRRLHRELPRPQQVQIIDGLSKDDLMRVLRSSFALISASTEEGFDYPVLEAKAEGIPTLISDIPVHREFHAASSLFFPVHDDGSQLASQLIDLMADLSLWKDLSKGGSRLANHLNLQIQITKINEQFDNVCSIN